MAVGNDEPSRWPCDVGQHHRCAHVPSGVAQRQAGQPVRASTAGEPLCGCVCHTDCPLTAVGSSAGWSQGCTCAGTVRARKLAGRRERPQGSGWAGVREFRRQRQPLRDARARADRAIRTRGNGQDRVTVERIIDEEYTARGLDLPVGIGRQMLVEQVLHPYSRAERVRVGVDVLSAIGVGAVRGLRWLKAHSAPVTDEELEEASPPTAEIVDADDDEEEEDLFYLPVGKDSLPVDSGADEQRVLAGFAAGAVWRASFLCFGRAELRLAVDGVVEVWPLDRNATARYGVISAEHAVPLLPYLRQACYAGQRAVATAARLEARTGGWSLHVMLPDREPLADA